MDPRVGTEFAGHRIESVVGRGGASVVYLAEHVQLGRKVALKVLAPHLADDEAFRERFIRESRIAAGLDHPNIVTVYDAGEVDGSLYISMHFVEGSDLGKILAAEGALEPARTISVLSQVASALDAAHAQGLVHRDVKPANILVTSSADLPDFERAYLSDFGISKRTTSREGLTRTGQFVGTVDYVAPEQITGAPVDGRTDVYSLGCVLFECLSGHVPYPGETGVATIYSHLHDRPPSLEGFGERGKRLDRVMARALAKSKEDRFPTCVGLIEAARSDLTDGPVTEIRSSPAAEDASQATQPVRSGAHRPTHSRPRPPRSALTLTLVGALLIGAVLVLSSALGGPDPTDRGSPTGGSASPSVSGSGSPSATGPTGRAPEPIRLSWIPAPLLGRVYGRTGRQQIIDAVVREGAIVGVGSAAPGGSTGKVDDAAAWRSTNGQRWDVLRSPAFRGEGEQRMVSVVEFDGHIVGAGWDGGDAAVWLSDDEGDTWVQSTSSALGGHGPQRIRGLVPFGDSLIALGTTWGEDPDAAAWITSDGRLWERMDMGPARPADQDMRAGVVVGSDLVAVGLTEELGDADAAVWLFDGQAWTQVDPSMFDEPGDQVTVDVVGGSAGLPIVAVGCEDPTERCDTSVAANADAVVWISDDGRSWDGVAAEGGGLTGEGRQVMRAVVVYGDQFVAVGSKEGLVDRDGGVWVSPDGTTWRAGHALATGLGGLGNQILRGVVVYERQGIALLGLGVTSQEAFEDGQVWIARPVDG